MPCHRAPRIPRKSFIEITHHGFTRVMYVTAGLNILYSSIAWSFLPHMPRLCNYCILGPIRRWYFITRGVVYTQNQMNDLFQGSRFTLSSRCTHDHPHALLAFHRVGVGLINVVCASSGLDPDILTSVFVTLSYSASMPLLVPFCAAQLWIFWFIDRLLIIKYHRSGSAVC